MPHAVIGLGGNEGDPTAQFDMALAKLADEPGTRVLRESTRMETAPIGGPSGQAKYLNAAALLETNRKPKLLLKRLAELEKEAGRERGSLWGPRPLDLDLLWCEGPPIRDNLIVPHPRLLARRFALLPAAEVAGDRVHPQTGWTLARHAEHLVSGPPLIAVIGQDDRMRERLVREAAAEVGWRFISGLRDVAAVVLDDFAGEAVESPQQRPTLVDCWPERLPVTPLFVLELRDLDTRERRKHWDYPPVFVDASPLAVLADDEDVSLTTGILRSFVRTQLVGAVLASQP